MGVFYRLTWVVENAASVNLGYGAVAGWFEGGGLEWVIRLASGCGKEVNKLRWGCTGLICFIRLTLVGIDGLR